LQNLEKSGYNRLSRRQVLQILGVSMGALAVGGCTGKLLEHGLSSSSKLEPLAASTSSLFWRTIQASKNLDKEYLRERSRKLKRIVKQLKKGQGNPTELASEARQAGYEIVGHWAERGVLRALDEDLEEILTITPESLVLPLPEIKARAKRLQLELGLSNDEILGWEKVYKWDKNVLLQAIKQEGSEMLWKRWLDKAFKAFAPSPSLIAETIPIPIPPFLPPWVRVLIYVLVTVLFTADPVDQGGECIPSPCPGQPPAPPPPTPPNPTCSEYACAGCFVQGTLIATPRGPKPIQTIQPGDSIYTFDFSTKDVAVRKVIETFKSHDQEILLLNFTGIEEIRCTPSHRFYTGQWSHARDLKPGDRVLGLDGQWKKLMTIRKEIKPQPIFNLHVDELHNYFVGQLGLLVHNSKTPNAVDGEAF